MNRYRVFMACVLLVCANLSSGAFRAQALGADQNQAGKPQALTGGERHCLIGPKRPLECYDTEAEALYVASGGYVRLPAGQTARDLSDAELFGVTSTIQAILYKDADYGGASLSIVNDTCSGWNNLASSWNDVVSSARTASCGVTIYVDTNLSGSSLSISPPGATYVGNTMNDQASSWSLP